jgi:hypothetical protein
MLLDPTGHTEFLHFFHTRNLPYNVLLCHFTIVNIIIIIIILITVILAVLSSLLWQSQNLLLFHDRINLDIQLFCTYLEVKTCIYKKTYHNVRTLTNPANISQIINAIKHLINENMTFVDYDGGSVTE